MEQLSELHAKPRARRLDNGPVLSSVAFTECCRDAASKPGSSNRGNPIRTCSSKTYRDEVLTFMPRPLTIGA
jgi:hypothetical protein